MSRFFLAMPIVAVCLIAAAATASAVAAEAAAARPLTAATPARALATASPQPLSPATAQAVRLTVEAQLAAMAAGDAERAYSYATPALRRQFGDAQNFMAMVRQGYPMVIRPAAAVFFVPLADGHGVLQQVQLRDAAGRLWLASYRLSPQPDGDWRIEGCSVAPDTTRRST